MKKLIALIIAVVVIVILIKTFYIETPISKNSGKTEVRTEVDEYIAKFKEGILFPKDAEKILLRPASQNFSVENGVNVCEENVYISAQITKDEFFSFINQLGLEESPDLFEFWPNVFFHKYLTNNAWDVTKTPNKYTYYGANPIAQIEMAARYENDKVFIRTKAKVELLEDYDGQMIGSRVIERK